MILPETFGAIGGPKWPDAINHYEIIPYHVVLKVELASDFISRVSLPAEFTEQDCELIIDAIKRAQSVAARMDSP